MGYGKKSARAPSRLFFPLRVGKRKGFTIERGCPRARISKKAKRLEKKKKKREKNCIRTKK